LEGNSLMAISRDNKGKGLPALPIIEAGTHPLRLCRVYDLGVQESEFKGKKKLASEILVGFEILDTFMVDEDGNEDTKKPRMVSRRLKLYKSATKGREFDWSRALDPTGKYNGDWAAMARDRVACFGAFIHNEKDGKVYSNLETLTSVPRNFPVPDGQVEIQIYDLDNPDLEVFEKLPDFIKEIIEKRIPDDRQPVLYAPKAAEEVVEDAEGDQPW
jgi:hypothetical protein